MIRKESKAQTQKSAGFDKEELFAHAYLKHMGNGAAAAREVFGLTNDNSAYVQASKMLRKDKVMKFIDEHMRVQRENFKKFAEQGPYYLTLIAQQLLRRIQDDDMPFDDFIKSAEMLARLAGVELSEAVTVARAKAEVVQPIPEQRPLGANDPNMRKVLFMLSPPLPSSETPLS